MKLIVLGLLLFVVASGLPFHSKNDEEISCNRGDSSLPTFKTLDQTLDGLQAVESAWFDNYAGVIAYDKQRTAGDTSMGISKRKRADFEDVIDDTLQDERYKSASNARSISKALLKVAAASELEDGSPIYIVTNSIVGDANRFDENLFALIGQKRLKIHVVILGDQWLPGNVTTYSNQGVQAFFKFAHSTGGGFYQVTDASRMATFWTSQIASQFKSATYSSAAFDKCFNTKELEFLVDDVNTKVMVDIYSPKVKDVTLFAPNGEPTKIASLSITLTNFLFSINVDQTGVYKIQTSNNGAPCSVSVRGVGVEDIFIVGFNDDFSNDNGLHSREADNFVFAGLPYAIVVYSKTSLLSHIEIYKKDSPESAVFVTNLIERDENCVWNYISAEAFTPGEYIYVMAIYSYNSKTGEKGRQIHEFIPIVG
ncbi:hypothetical protein M3Y97_00922000 [Aphelenchoides bicaudatus]|nr:hypothetical protein M3Y97_00922000 [Aphelenchoides bicaudatus]